MTELLRAAADRRPGGAPAGPRMRFHYGSRIFGYAIAIGLTAVAGAAHIVLVGDVQARAPFFLFYPAMALAAFLAGIGPGLTTTLCTALFAARLFPQMPGRLSWLALAVLGPIVTMIFARIRFIREESRALARELERFKYIGDHASDLILLLRESGHIHYANQTACAALGWAEEHLLGRPVSSLVPESQRAGLSDLLERSKTGSVQPVELMFERRDKTTVLLELSCTGVRTREEQVIHAAARDITERRQIEQKLREVRLWESLGVMAGGLAHDFNNLLTSIIGNAALAKDILPADHAAAGMLDGVVSAGERSADLVRMMLATSGHRSRESEALDLDHVLSWVLSSHPLPKQVTITRDIQGSGFTGDRRSLETLLWSLISNAAESYEGAPGWVKIRIRLSLMRHIGLASFEEGSEQDCQCLEIVVEDGGCGMTPEVLDRAFDPFFSTKFTGRGLGLPAVRGIVRSYSGSLRIYTAPGQGSKVEARLPIAG